MEQKTETKLNPEEIPEYQGKLSQSLIKDWRERLHYTDEQIIEALESI